MSPWSIDSGVLGRRRWRERWLFKNIFLIKLVHTKAAWLGLICKVCWIPSWVKETREDEIYCLSKSHFCFLVLNPENCCVLTFPTGLCWPSLAPIRIDWSAVDSSECQWGSVYSPAFGKRDKTSWQTSAGHLTSADVSPEHVSTSSNKGSSKYLI